MNYKDEMKKLNIKIEEAKLLKAPLEKLYRKQLKILEYSHNEFILKAKESGYDLSTNMNIAEIEIKQFSAMKQVAQKLNIPFEEYDKMIYDVRVRIFGEKATLEFFKKEV